MCLSSGWSGTASLIHSAHPVRPVEFVLWLVGNGLFDTLGSRDVSGVCKLWLVGNGLFDTLFRADEIEARMLWLVGNGLFDTLVLRGVCEADKALAGRERPL